MRDESWCSGCGTSLPYSEEDVECGACTEQYPQKLVELIKYMELHLISLQQDSEGISQEMDLLEDLNGDAFDTLEIADISTNGQIIATAHLLSVARDILGIQTEEK